MQLLRRVGKQGFAWDPAALLRSAKRTSWYGGGFQRPSLLAWAVGLDLVLSLETT
jgi:hypothetical protein